MADELNHSIKCSRCGEYHIRLIPIHKNDEGKIVYECLDCLAELLIGRGQHNDKLIGKKDLCRSLEYLSKTI